MIRTRSLTKDFPISRTQTVHAVRGISLQIEPGELVAVLGPNGAGKTTTMRMLTTLIAPSSGTATVAGHDVVTAPAQVRRRIGYVGQGNGAGHTQRVRDELDTQGVIYGLDRRAARRRAGELLDALDLTELAGRKVSALSGGQRRRLDVAAQRAHGDLEPFRQVGAWPVPMGLQQRQQPQRPGARVRHATSLPKFRSESGTCGS